MSCNCKRGANVAAVLLNPQAVGQSTPAMQWAFAKASGARGGRRSAAKRRRSKVTNRRRKSVKRTASPKRGRRARLVKGSAAARRHMAKIRRMRKRK